MRDSLNNHAYRVAIARAVVADNTAQVGNIIDRSGFDALTFAILTGTLADADATFAVLVEHGDAANLSDAAAVADEHLVSAVKGTAPEAAAGFTFVADNATRKIGYVGGKRYVRLTVTPSGNSGNAPLAAVADLSHAATRPVAYGTAPMRLAANETTLKIGEAKITLRPSLRAAYQLLADEGALLPLLAGISNFDTAIISRIIRESATDEDEAEHFITAIHHGAGSLASKSAIIVPSLIGHVTALLGTHGRTTDKPANAEPETKQVSIAEYLEELFSIGTGWLYWTPETTRNATPAEILAAHAGHMKMLQALYGSRSEAESEPDFERDEAGFAELKAMSGVKG